MIFFFQPPEQLDIKKKKKKKRPFCHDYPRLLCTLWLTGDRWLLYGSRHRWTHPLNLPLSQDPLNSHYSPSYRPSETSTHRVCGCVLKWVHLHSTPSTPSSSQRAPTPALTIQFLPNCDIKKKQSRSYTSSMNSSTHQHTPFGGGRSIERERERREGVKHSPPIRTCFAQKAWE